MKAIRKIIINEREIDIAIKMNTQLISENAGNRYAPQITIPQPLYNNVQFNFRPHNVQDWYTECGPDRDIIANVLYAGTIRFEYDPLLETQFEAMFSA